MWAGCSNILKFYQQNTLRIKQGFEKVAKIRHCAENSVFMQFLRLHATYVFWRWLITVGSGGGERGV